MKAWQGESSLGYTIQIDRVGTHGGAHKSGRRERVSSARLDQWVGSAVA